MPSSHSKGITHRHSTSNFVWNLRIIFVNTPLLFETVWNFIKEGISPETLKKIHFVGSDFEETLDKEV